MDWKIEIHRSTPLGTAIRFGLEDQTVLFDDMTVAEFYYEEPKAKSRGKFLWLVSENQEEVRINTANDTLSHNMGGSELHIALPSECVEELEEKLEEL